MDSVFDKKLIYKLIEMFSGIGARSMDNVPLKGIVFIIFVSLLGSFFISFLYLKFYENRSTGSQIHRAFPLLGISITSIFICIQFSLPLSLGLLGALSIVRFRTPIKEPEEIGFIMLIVAIAIACATFNLIIMATVLAIAIMALLFAKYATGFINPYHKYGMIIVTLPIDISHKKRTEIEYLMKKYLNHFKVSSVSSDEANSTITYSFKVNRKAKNWSALESNLFELVKPHSLNIFFGRQSVI
jgi:hypothetical protein